MKFTLRYIGYYFLILILWSGIKFVFGHEFYCNVGVRIASNLIILLMLFWIYTKQRSEAGLSIEFGILYQSALLFITLGIFFKLLINYFIVHLVNSEYVTYLSYSNFNAWMWLESISTNYTPVDRAKAIAFYEPNTIENFSLKGFFVEWFEYSLFFSIVGGLVLVYITRVTLRKYLKSHRRLN